MGEPLYAMRQSAASRSYGAPMRLRPQTSRESDNSSRRFAHVANLQPMPFHNGPAFLNPRRDALTPRRACD